MSVRSETNSPAINPWLFVPLLYLMQAIPVTVVQELSVVFFKDLGVANEPITRWTSLISLPWSLQLLLGPLVDLNGTKRRWILGGQTLISGGLIGTAALLHAPYFFELTLLILAATAITSALCNIATDGFYIIAMSREQQAKYVGVQSSCYKLGRLLCMGLLVWVVGLMTMAHTVHVQAPAGSKIAVSATTQTDAADIGFRDGLLATSTGVNFEPQIVAPLGVYRLEIMPDGEIKTRSASGDQSLGRLPIAGSAGFSSPAILTVGPPSEAMNPATAWTIILAALAVFYFLGRLINSRTVPRPDDDVPAAAQDAGETRQNVLRAVDLVAIGVFGYFFLNAVTRLLAQLIFSTCQSLTSVDLKGWDLPAEGKIIGFDTHLGGIGAEVLQLVGCGLLLAVGLVMARRLLRGSAMADALQSYVRQDGFPAIFFFILFYRFGEAMIGKMTPLFLKDTIANGGLAVPNELFGPIKGFAGVVGIILGGLAGGWIVSRLGLRRAFWLLAVCMHAPNLLYLWASYQHPGIPALYGIEFVDQFGYGFGFAAYGVYLMWVAQRGRYRTSHYAVGTGMGALCIATAGIVSGIVQKNFGYHGFFISVIFLSLPGLLSLLFIPLDDRANPQTT